MKRCKGGDGAELGLNDYVRILFLSVQEYRLERRTQFRSLGGSIITAANNDKECI